MAALGATWHAEAVPSSCRQASERRSSPSYRCRAERQVFQLTASRRNVTYDDLWSAAETCDALHGDSRRDCYAAVGIDADRVDAYLGRTLSLEAAFQASEAPQEVVVQTPFGEAHLPRPKWPSGLPQAPTLPSMPQLPQHIHMPQMPQMPQMPRLPEMPHLRMAQLPHLQAMQANFEKLSHASQQSQEQVRRFFAAVVHFQEELNHSAKLMFDEDEELWDECLQPSTSEQGLEQASRQRHSQQQP